MTFSIRRVLFSVLALTLFVVSGCADMPITSVPPGEDQPIGQASLVLGPYLSSSDTMQPFFRFVTNRRCVAGIQSLDTSRKYVNRQASFSLFHALAIPELDVTGLRRYRLWLDDQDGGAYAVRGLPRTGQAVSLGFSGAEANSYRLAMVGNSLRTLDTNAVVFTSGPFGDAKPANPADWETEFFGPLGDKVAFGPMWFTPGTGVPAELFPEHGAEGGYWKRDVGALRIIGIDARAFSFDSSRAAALARLERDLDPTHTQRAWTVLVLSRSAFDARVGDGRILTALADRLELGGVDLVIGHGAYYLRTRPFAVSGMGQTRYISVADGEGGIAPNLAPREYVAAWSDQPHVARLWADEGTLEWRVVDLQGNTLDLLTLESQRQPIEQPLSKWEIVSDAQAALTLQKEMLRITRQAAKSVPDPGREMLLSLYFANPTTRRFNGNLQWNIPAESGWVVEPPVMPFDLQPGQGAAARFRVRPGATVSVPLLTASSLDVGTTTGSLHLTREKRYDVYPVMDPIRLDARLRDKSYWLTAPVLTGFETENGERATNPTEARIVADHDGLIIAASMAGKSVASANPRASNPEEHRDGPVIEDESFEIYLDPYRRGRDYYHFAVNPRNVVLDESSHSGLSYNPTWRRTVRFGRAGQYETWDVEIRIPWEALDLAGPPKEGEEWGMQLVRRDYSPVREAGSRRGKAAAAVPEVSQWMPTYGDNTRPGLYGVLRFGDLSEAPSGDGGRAAPEPGFLLRGGGGGQLPQRPGRILTPLPEPSVPDF